MNRSTTQRNLELASVRPAIQVFAIEMEKKLRESGYTDPGWWHDCDSAFLGVKLVNEAEELLGFFSMDQCNVCIQSREECEKCNFPLPDGSAEKAVDVATLCMMLWSKKGNC